MNSNHVLRRGSRLIFTSYFLLNVLIEDLVVEAKGGSGGGGRGSSSSRSSSSSSSSSSLSSGSSWFSGSSSKSFHHYGGGGGGRLLTNFHPVLEIFFWLFVLVLLIWIQSKLKEKCLKVKENDEEKRQSEQKLVVPPTWPSRVVVEQPVQPPRRNIFA